MNIHHNWPMTESPSAQIGSTSTLRGGEIEYPAVQILTQLIVNKNYQHSETWVNITWIWTKVT